jgi:CheY-like chemotaxis protein
MTHLAILIVEDNTITALHLRQTLEAAGHSVTGMARTL